MKKILAITAIVFLTLSCTGCVGYMNEQTTTCEVKDKWIKRPSGSENELYLVTKTI